MIEARELALAGARSREAELVEAAKAFLPEAWSEIYDRFYSKIYVYLYFRLNDRASAEDLASEVFLRACRGIGSYTYRGAPLVSWLYRIAENLSSDFLRRQPPAMRPLNESREEATGSDLETVDLRIVLIKALGRLTPEQRQVVVMRIVGGMSLAEVADALGRSQAAVKGLQHRALASLRRHLSRNGETQR